MATPADHNVEAELAELRAQLAEHPDISREMLQQIEAVFAELEANPGLIPQVLEQVPELREVVEAARSELEKQLALPAAKKACKTCPFRVLNFGDTDVTDPKAREWYYTRRTRFALWDGITVVHEDGIVPGVAGYGLKDGGAMTCRLTVKQVDSSLEQASAHSCAGGRGLQHRELLRWFMGGKSALTKKGATRVVAKMFDTEEREVDILDTADGQRLLKVRGLELALEDLIERTHPSAFDPLVLTEESYPFTPDEREALARAPGARV